MNELLRRALADRQLTESELAGQVGVDPKTVHRWLAGRVPYPRHRTKVAKLLGITATELWPQTSIHRPSRDPVGAEIVTAYPHRWAVPRTVWQRFFESAHHEIGILAYAGLFLAEDFGITRTLAEKARGGVKIRILLGDPASPHVFERGNNEEVGESIAAKIQNARVLYRSLSGVQNVELRLHDTVLYNSIYRADDDLLVNSHAYGIPASYAPVIHMRWAQDNDMASTYLDSFNRVWDQAAISIQRKGS
ncbi:multiprotein-bridging factor 1 family protein [Spirillospora sp. NPDC127200]